MHRYRGGGNRGSGHPLPPEQFQKYRVSEQNWSGSPDKAQSCQASTQRRVIIGTPAKHHLNNISFWIRACTTDLLLQSLKGGDGQIDQINLFFEFSLQNERERRHQSILTYVLGAQKNRFIETFLKYPQHCFQCTSNSDLAPPVIQHLKKTIVKFMCGSRGGDRGFGTPS